MPVCKKSVLLAPNEQIEFSDTRLKYPLLGSLKYDGVRGLCIRGEFFSRNMKPFKNEKLAEHFSGIAEVSAGRHLVFDFEIYDHSMPDFGSHMSVIGAKSASIPDTLCCHVFDVLTYDEWERVESDNYIKPFELRHQTYTEILRTDSRLHDGKYVAVEQVLVESADDAQLFFEVSQEEGYEGIMLRDPQGRYKHGRATHNEGIIFKFKAFETMDGRIIEVVQRRKMKEGVERTTTPTGHMERVHTKDSYTLDDMVGAFKVEFEDGTISEVNYGRGFPHDVRRNHWGDREHLIGRHVEVRHLPHGAKDGIRIGTLVRFRTDKDG